MQIGTGHLFRCLTLADELRRCGAHTRFVSRTLPPHLQTLLEARGHGFAMLSPCADEPEPSDLAHAHWLDASQARDATDTGRALEADGWDWLVVDHYALDARWESKLRNQVRRIAVIDDLADRDHDCDLLVDHNVHEQMAERYAARLPPLCARLVGPQYALLREEFRAVRERGVTPRRGQVKRLLAFFGGMDAGNFTGACIAALGELRLHGLHVDVVIGAQHPARDEIENECQRLGFSCHVQTADMAELIARTDLAIGAGGITTWERCCLGLPAFVLPLAHNQIVQLEEAAKAGVVYAPALGGALPAFIERHVLALLENDSLRAHLSANGMQAVDGHGALRVVAAMGCGGITLRRANPLDSSNLHEWRNHPSVRAVSRSTEPIPRTTHERWIASMLASNEHMLLIGERGSEPVGVVRFDLHGKDAEISIYLVPKLRHAPGEGRYLLQAAEAWLLANVPEVTTVRAEVLGLNERSRRLFVGAGYELRSTSYVKKFDSK